jgi:hypothetical protein
MFVFGFWGGAIGALVRFVELNPYSDRSTFLSVSVFIFLRSIDLFGTYGGQKTAL